MIVNGSHYVRIHEYQLHLHTLRVVECIGMTILYMNEYLSIRCQFNKPMCSVSCFKSFDLTVLITNTVLVFAMLIK